MKCFFIKLFGFSSIVLACIVLIVLFIPHPFDYFKEQSIKDQMIDEPSREQSIVLLGGSNVIYGFDSKAIEDSLKINTINDGFHAGLGMKFILENCSHRLISGDILVVCPEYEHFLGHGCYGEPLGLGMTVLTNPRYIKSLDSKQLWIVSKTVPYYIKTMLPYYQFWDDNLNLASFNSKGDIYLNEERVTDVEAGQRINDTVLNKLFCNSFFRQLQALESNGIKVVVYPPSYMLSCYLQNENLIDKIGSVFETEGFPPLCDWSDCAYDDSLFYDTRYHLNKNGAKINTSQLIRLLKTKL